jgi:hypothetical protein
VIAPKVNPFAKAHAKADKKVAEAKKDLNEVKVDAAKK